MSQLTIKISAKADALIAQLQKEIFNRRRKKVTAQGVVETLVESGAKSQSDKRYAASWKNLIKDIEKAAKVSETHGNKPANISQEEWTLILSHRTRKGSPAKKAPVKRASKASKVKPSKAKSPSTKKVVAKKAAPAKPATPRRARRARKAPVASVKKS
tara:strand:- start:160 stop:633 length:474 start_codon:yes stop_codon:yes gene_type:complete